MPYSSPKGGSRTPTPKPGPTLGRITRSAWRQPIGGVRPSASPGASR